MSGVLDVDSDYLNGEMRAEFQAVIHRDLSLSECVDAYALIKNTLT